MTDAAELDDLERGYRRWLRWYPRSFRREHEAEILGVLLAGARAGQQGPAPMECLDLLRSAVWIRLRPRVPRSDRAAWAAVKLMYVGAVVELAAAITILLPSATSGRPSCNAIRSFPRTNGTRSSPASWYLWRWWPVSRSGSGCGWPGRSAAGIAGREWCSPSSSA